MSYRTDSPPSPLVVCVTPGVIAARDRRTGKLVWQAFTDPSAARFALVTRLVVHGDRVIVVAPHEASAGFLSTQQADAVVMCLEYMTGRHLWAVRIEGSPGLNFSPTLLADGADVFVAHGTSLACIHLESGQLLWIERIGSDQSSSYALAVPGAAAQADRK